MQQFKHLLPFALLVIAFVALFFVLRGAFVFAVASYSEAVDRAQLLPSFFAGILVCTFDLMRAGRRIGPCIAIGAAAALGVALPLAIELAEIARINWSYWDWSNDYPEFVGILFKHSFLGALVGGIVGAAFGIARKSRLRT